MTIEQLLDLLADHTDPTDILNALGVYAEMRAIPDRGEDARWALECGLVEMGIIPEPTCRCAR